LFFLLNEFPLLELSPEEGTLIENSDNKHSSDVNRSRSKSTSLGMGLLPPTAEGKSRPVTSIDKIDGRNRFKMMKAKLALVWL
jgi:hypothetical protein